MNIELLQFYYSRVEGSWASMNVIAFHEKAGRSQEDSILVLLNTFLFSPAE